MQTCLVPVASLSCSHCFTAVLHYKQCFLSWGPHRQRVAAAARSASGTPAPGPTLWPVRPPAAVSERPACGPPRWRGRRCWRGTAPGPEIDQGFQVEGSAVSGVRHTGQPHVSRASEAAKCEDPGQQAGFLPSPTTCRVWARLAATHCFSAPREPQHQAGKPALHPVTVSAPALGQACVAAASSGPLLWDRFAPSQRHSQASARRQSRCTCLHCVFCCAGREDIGANMTSSHPPKAPHTGRRRDQPDRPAQQALPLPAQRVLAQRQPSWRPGWSSPRPVQEHTFWA